MELSHDWHKRTNIKLMDILSDVMKEPKPPKVTPTLQSQRPSHGYTIAEKKPEVVTAPGVYFPATHGEVLSPERYAQKTGLISRQGGGEVRPTLPQEQPLSSFRPQVAQNQDLGTRLEGPPPSLPSSDMTSNPNTWGTRADGTPKGPGFMGTMQRPDGKISTELSVGVNIDGKEVQIPTLIPTLTPEEIKYLLGGGKPTDAIVGKAVEYAKSRMAKGLSPFAQEGEQGPAPSMASPPEAGSTVPLISRQVGGEVDPSLFKETSSVGPENLSGDQVARTALLSRTPDASGASAVNPLPNAAPLRSYYDAHPEEKNATVTPVSPSAPLTGMAEYEANANKMRGVVTPTVGRVAPAGPIDKRLSLPTGALSSFMKPIPAFRENTRSPIFGSDQRAAYDKKWKTYNDFLKSFGAESTPLFARANEGPVSPTIDENLTEEQRRRLYQEYQAKLANRNENVVDLTPNPAGAFEVKTPAEAVKAPVTTPTSLSEISKESLPSGETRYTLPGTEGTATVSPERFFAGGKEVQKGTTGAVSGDELARQRILREATPDLTLAKSSYYDVHPEERAMDEATQANKPLMDAYNKLREENTARAQGFGLPMGPKAKRAMQVEAAKNVPELTAGLERMQVANMAMPERYYSADAKLAAAEARGAGRTGSSRPVAEKAPTELGLIAKSQEVGPDGKLTDEAKQAQKILDAEKKRKIDIQSGGVAVPEMGEIPPTLPGTRNEAALEGLSASDAAVIKNLVDYKIPYPSSFALRSPQWKNIIARAALYDPTFDSTQYPVRQRLRIDFTSGTAAKNILGLNTAVGHIDSLVKAEKDLANSNWVTGNAAVNLLAKYFPVTGGLVERQGAVTGIKTKFNAVKDEMAGIFKRSGATDPAIKAWADTVTDPSTATPTMWKAFINGSIELMGSRLGALQSQYETGMGKPKDFSFLSPKSREILKNIPGVDVNAIDPVAGTPVGKQGQTGEVVPRLPGETVQQYLKRTGG